ncbi:MAG TPA: wax ester/triacylglycerol synthase family O-acyltransferase [Burkholderiaceae bacterium]|nr:wax ester/triacylglycerol synthase family O-acyltransferase [Burkholderiaceae bacterium]
MGSERMSRVDLAWLRMDSPTNLMQIVGVWWLTPRLAHDALTARVRERLLAWRRFRQTVVLDDAGALWVDDGAFDLARHVTRETLVRARGESLDAALRRRVAALAAQALPRDRPLWQFHLIEDFGAGRSALVTRIHHCIADGIALISVLLAIADGGQVPRRRGTEDDPLQPLTQFAALALDAVTHPSESIDTALVALRAVQDAAALALMADDAPTRLKGATTTDKRVAWGDPLPLDAVKAVGRAFGASVNDVLLACVAGALGDHLRAAGDALDAQDELRAMVPVNLRRAARATELGNRFGLAPLLLPIGDPHPGARLFTIRSRMNELKSSTQPLLAFGLLALSGLVAKPVQDAITQLFSKKASAVVTNVPGPREPIHFCGSTVERIMFWVPQTGDIGLGVSVLSYAGSVHCGLIADAARCPDPQAVVARFAPQFATLEWLALMAPWPALD